MILPSSATLRELAREAQPGDERRLAATGDVRRGPRSSRASLGLKNSSLGPIAVPLDVSSSTAIEFGPCSDRLLNPELVELSAKPVAAESTSRRRRSPSCPSPSIIAGRCHLSTTLGRVLLNPGPGIPIMYSTRSPPRRARPSRRARREPYPSSRREPEGAEIAGASVLGARA